MVCHHAWLFRLSAGDQLRASCLPGKHLPDWAITPFSPVLWASWIKVQERWRPLLLVYSPNVCSNVGRRSTEEKLSSAGIFEPSDLSRNQLVLNFHFEDLVSTNIYIYFFHFVIEYCKVTRNCLRKKIGTWKPWQWLQPSVCISLSLLQNPGAATAPNSYSGSPSEPSNLYS